MSVRVGLVAGASSCTVKPETTASDADLVLSPKGTGSVLLVDVPVKGSVVTTPVYYDYGGSTQNSSFVSSGHAWMNSDPTPVLANANFNTNRKQASSLPADITMTSPGSGNGMHWSASSSRRWTVTGTTSYEYHCEIAIARGSGSTPGMIVSQIATDGTTSMRFRYVSGANTDYLQDCAGMNGVLAPGEALGIAVYGTSIHTISWDVQFRAIGFS